MSYLLCIYLCCELFMGLVLVDALIKVRNSKKIIFVAQKKLPFGISEGKFEIFKEYIKNSQI